jgi:hypothetical protein
VVNFNNNGITLNFKYWLIHQISAAMKNKSLLLLLFSALIVISCQKDEFPGKQTIQTPSSGVDKCEQEAVENGWIIESNGSKWLYGGFDSSWHFNINTFELKTCQLRFGLGRESFKALIDPQYILLSEDPTPFQNNDKFIIVSQGTDLPEKVYPIGLMIKHEVINEVINGQPVMIAYCVLADLGAVYTRIYCGEELTFALSGFTYHDDEVWGGLDAFVLWDRDTESLWWPLIDRAVSGQMNGTQLEKYSGGWLDMTYEEIETTYGLENVLVLQSGQTMEVPENWLRLEEVDCD